MNVTVGQELAGGKIVVASIDQNDRILSVTFPLLTDNFGRPLVITFGYGLTIDEVLTLLPHS